MVAVRPNAQAAPCMAKACNYEMQIEKILFTINGLLGSGAYSAHIQSSGSWVVPSHPV
jgi:hypothetical protein